MTSYRQETVPSEPKAIALEPTAKLRWKEIETSKKYFMHKVLQQLWVDKLTGYSEWKDIPTE